MTLSPFKKWRDFLKKIVVQERLGLSALLCIPFSYQVHYSTTLLMEVDLRYERKIFYPTVGCTTKVFMLAGTPPPPKKKNPIDPILLTQYVEHLSTIFRVETQYRK